MFSTLQFCGIILLFNGFGVFINIDVFDTATFITSYIPLVIFPMLYFGYMFVKKTKLIPLADIDFYSGTRDIDESDDPVPTTWYGKVWGALM